MDTTTTTVDPSPDVIVNPPETPGTSGDADAQATAIPTVDTKSAPETSTNTVTANIKSIEGEVKFASIIQEIEVFFQGSGQRKKTRLKLKEIWKVTELRQKELAESFVADQIEIQRLQNVLRDKRVLVLSGEAGLGKAATAVYLAHSLSEHLKTQLSSGEENKPEYLNTYMIPTPGPSDSIDWDELWRDGQNGCFVIFQDAFADRNQDLAAFVKQLKEFSLAEFAEKLKEKHSYLVLTTTASEISQNSLASGVACELKPLSAELLSNGLMQRLNALSDKDGVPAGQLDFLRQPGHSQTLITQLKTMPRIVRFVEHFLERSSMSDSDLDFEEVVRRFEDISIWFQRELMADFEFWCFTLALGLVHWQQNAKEVSWYEFEKIRRSVRVCLKGDPELFPPRKYLADEGPTETTLATVALSDDLFLEKCRAKIEKDPIDMGDQISFRDPSYPRKLWELMLLHHRRVLGILLKHLREVAENPTTDYGTRSLCAQVIGRIGEIDPERITRPLINRWVYADEVKLRAAVAALYEGILASENERYRQYSLDFLDTLTDDDRHNRAEKNRLLTAIAVYSRVGNLDLVRAMNGLKRIVLRKLAPAMKDISDIQNYLDRTEKKFKDKLVGEAATAWTIYQEMLRDWAERIYNQQSRTLLGVQFALCSLALNAGPSPIPIFRELRRWIETSNQQTGTLIALMFLFEDGIAETLGKAKVEINDDDSITSGRSASPIILALASDHESVVEMARFLVTLYESFTSSVYPKQFRQYLRTSLMLQLSLWVEEGLRVEGCQEGIQQLFAELIKIHNGIMFDLIYELLHHADFSRTNSALKRAFVKKIFWQQH